MPLSPNDNEVYLYAVFNNDIGDNQAYVLSTQIENTDGTRDVWTTGSNISDYSDFDVIEQDNVTIIHTEMSEAEYLESLNPSEEVEEITEEETVEEESEETTPTHVPRPQ